MFHSRHPSQRPPLPVVAVSVPSLSELCGSHLPPPSRVSAFDSVRAVVRAQMLSARALREQKESKQRALFSISYKCQLFQLLLNHILTNSGGRGFPLLAKNVCPIPAKTVDCTRLRHQLPSAVAESIPMPEEKKLTPAAPASAADSNKDALIDAVLAGR